VREKTGKPIVLAAYMNYDQPVVTRYEAEDATLYNVGTNTNHTGYTGSGFVNDFGESGDYVQFSVTGTSLNWSYDSTTGRVRLYGTLNASTSEDITINF